MNEVPESEGPENKPILAFLCHPHSVVKAEKTIYKLVTGLEDEAKKEMLKLPVRGLKGTPKNILSQLRLTMSRYLQ